MRIPIDRRTLTQSPGIRDDQLKNFERTLTKNYPFRWVFSMEAMRIQTELENSPERKRDSRNISARGLGLLRSEQLIDLLRNDVDIGRVLHTLTVDEHRGSALNGHRFTKL